MSKEITIEVCDMHGSIHEQMQEGLDGYEERLRDELEGTIHELYQHAERARERNEKRVAEVEMQEQESG